VYYTQFQFSKRIRPPEKSASYNTSKYDKVLRKPFLFFHDAHCTNNNDLFQTLLALTKIFLIHQCVHFWPASTALPGAKTLGNLQFTNLEEVSVQTKQGNIRNCNGNVSQVPTYVSGVLVVECLPNNVGPVKPPADGLNVTVTVQKPNDKSGGDSTDPNGRITTLVEKWSGHGPNVIVSKGPTPNLVAIPNADTNTVTRSLYRRN